MIPITIMYLRLESCWLRWTVDTVVDSRVQRIEGVFGTSQGRLKESAFS
jgi:hypothetical protein